ncbi:MAG: hypothetical protein ACI9C4_002167, partial [Paraglaciecola sp.]
SSSYLCEVSKIDQAKGSIKYRTFEDHCHL